MAENVKTWGIPIAGLLCMAISSYIAVRTANGSIVVELLCGSLMIASIALMTWAVVRTVKGRQRTDAAEREMQKVRQQLTNLQEALRLDPLQLEIHSATWGNKASRKSVIDAIRDKPRNALMFHVSQDAFPLPDPASGDDNKYIEVEYSYTGSARLTIQRPQGSWIILPEDPWPREKEAIADRQNKELVKNAPRVSIEYKHDRSKGRELLLLRNDKDDEARYLTFEEIYTLVKHRVVPLGPVPPIVGGGPQQECAVVIYSGVSGEAKPLYQVLSEGLINSADTIKVYYDDHAGHHFYREFTLKQQLEKVIWEPGPVCLVRTSDS